MKVLIIPTSIPREDNPSRGVFVVKRLQQYKKFGVDYTAVSFDFEDGPLVSLARKLTKNTKSRLMHSYDGVEFKYVLLRRGLISIINQFLRPNGYKDVVAKFAEKIGKIVNVDDFDVIHAHGMYAIPAGEIARLLAEMYGKPYIVTLHGGDVNDVMPKRIEYVEILEKAAKVIFVSNAILQRAKSFGYSGKNAVVIPNGYDPEIFKPMNKVEVRKRLGIYKEGYKYVGFVGNLIETKRADKLGEIFHLIQKEFPKVYFIVVGDGYLKEKIQQETRDLEVLFTGRIEQKQVALYMNAMDVLILPSRNEGFGTVIIEAQACGTCVVGSSNGGIPEAIGFEEYIVEECIEFEKRFAEKVVWSIKNGKEPTIFLNRVRNFQWRYVVEEEINIYKSTI
ncbi:MAG TPA: glycosyltransferase family 4 protein [Fervidobacterium sp.]|nr:glycosyltransferase family 4 protein [Fervidobacterium sp.]